jgi:hypothetical protein
MIVFVPTPPPPEKWPPGIEFGVLTTMSFPVPVPRFIDKVFVDLSLRRTRVGVEFHMYARFVGKVRAMEVFLFRWLEKALGKKLTFDKPNRHDSLGRHL